MVLCAIVDCSSRSDNGSGISFYGIPTVTDRYGEAELELRKKRRDGYLAAISRADLDLTALHNYKICEKHFHSGKPAYLYNTTDPDWLPTLHLGHKEHGSADTADVTASVDRWRRAQEREKWKRIEELLPTLVAEEVQVIVAEEIRLVATEQIEIARQYFRPVDSCECSSKIESLQKELAKSKEHATSLTMELKKLTFNEECLVDDDFAKTHTGLPNAKTVKAVFEHVLKTLPSDGVTKLSPFQEFMCVLLKLRMNSSVEYLAYRFGVSPSTVSRIFLKWLKQMDLRLSNLILWPDREALRKTMPACFQASFGKKVAIIIDCFEIFIDRPSNLQARASTWSNYKHNNTVKVLIGITPQGVVSFVSKCWGGRVSDKYLTDHCGLLGKLLPGDVVLADRGFDIAESVGLMQASLHIPAFTRGKQQLSAIEIEDTRQIANVRIHVERVIGCVRQKYSILRSTVPINFVTKRANEEVPILDHIVRVCCALNNLCDSVVLFE
ncbi:uncharacterized protein [Dysidea avara]|uniref:uncharacterized protein n=1 Tax=Dysidea avara TaxID=196820 RepID=UPI0033224549